MARIILIKQKENLKKWENLMDTFWILDRELREFICENIFDVDKRELDNIKLNKTDDVPKLNKGWGRSYGY